MHFKSANTTDLRITSRMYDASHGRAYGGEGHESGQILSFRAAAVGTAYGVCITAHHFADVRNMVSHGSRIGSDHMRNRPDKDGTHRGAFEKNKKKILASQRTCGICGRPVDFTKKYPHPLSPCIDHIIPINRGGHPSDMDNLQLAHWTCNRQKADKLAMRSAPKELETLSNRILPQSMDWKAYRG